MFTKPVRPLALNWVQKSNFVVFSKTTTACKLFIFTKVSEGLGRAKGEAGQVQKQLEKERAEHRRKVDRIETDLDTARADNQVRVIFNKNFRFEI